MPCTATECALAREPIVCFYSQQENIFLFSHMACSRRTKVTKGVFFAACVSR